GIHAAWHFGFAVSFGGEGGLRKFGLGSIHPLTQRYDNYLEYCINENFICLLRF
ncbi:TPA: DUF3265 domain-containing protein, partial [Vibrio vulnificus]|nr:DUF3265 domain-containing protein [Vibrio vulnificus]HAS8277884.1 DUF3265 domain-containing protein [Vibrio vulnificus]